MSTVYEEFERQLERLSKVHRSDPRAEFTKLLLLALEREELVAIGYRDAMMTRRLVNMPIDDELRHVVRHAFIWAWKDEEMHALYVRGAILQVRDRWLSFRARINELSGILGGWASSFRQHVRWHEAPLAHLIATTITVGGKILGQVPVEVRDYLRYRPFRDFCLFNVDAERTAWLCYDRMIALSEEKLALPPELVSELKRVRDDERRHEKIFQICADAFTPVDSLAPDYNKERLITEIGAVGAYFLPREYRVLSSNNPLGSGAQVAIAQDRSGGNKLALFDEVLDHAGLLAAATERAGLLGKLPKELRIVIKPTFMMGYDTRDRSPITDPELIAALVRHLRRAGFVNLTVVESSKIYELFYRNRTVPSVARYMGIDTTQFQLVDLNDQQRPHHYERGMSQHYVSDIWSSADFRISFGKMRSHPIDVVCLTLSNIEGIGKNWHDYVFAERQADYHTAVMMVLDEFPCHFAILDAYEAVPGGPLGVMGSAAPRDLYRIYASRDALSLDIVAARHMGVTNLDESKMLQTACYWFGDPRAKLQVTGPDEPISDWRGPWRCNVRFAGDFANLFGFAAHLVYQFGSSRGALFVPEMDTSTFPEHSSPSLRLRFARSLMHRACGLRLHRQEQKK